MAKKARASRIEGSSDTPEDARETWGNVQMGNIDPTRFGHDGAVMPRESGITPQDQGLNETRASSTVATAGNTERNEPDKCLYACLWALHLDPSTETKHA